MLAGEIPPWTVKMLEWEGDGGGGGGAGAVGEGGAALKPGLPSYLILTQLKLYIIVQSLIH